MIPATNKQTWIKGEKVGEFDDEQSSFWGGERLVVIKNGDSFVS